MKYFSILLILVLFVACLSRKNTTTASLAPAAPIPTEYERVSAKFPEYTLTEFNEGKKLYTQHCGTCHVLKNPIYGTQDSWKKIVPPMVTKVNKKEGNVIDIAGEESLLKYVLALNSVGPSK